MAENTKIEWTDHTFNPWTGCTKVSPGCDHCYAEGWSKRAGDKVGKWGPGASRVRTTPANWAKPLKWQANAASFMAEHGRRQRVFCASLADVFDNEVPPEWRLDLFKLIAATPDLDWLLLTKRIGNAKAMMDEVTRAQPIPGRRADPDPISWQPMDNVWLGATITSQAEADRDIRKLLSVPARIRFLSIEPLLGPVNLTDVPGPESGHGHHEFSPIITINALKRADSQKTRIDWVIVGGESGPGARPMHPDWARSLRDQCASAGVPFLFKQWGNWRAAVWFDGPDAELDEGDDFIDLDRVNHQFLAADGRTWDTSGGRHMYPPLPLGHWCLMVNEGKKAAGRLLDGVEHNRFPGVHHG